MDIIIELGFGVILGICSGFMPWSTLFEKGVPILDLDSFCYLGGYRQNHAMAIMVSLPQSVNQWYPAIIGHAIGRFSLKTKKFALRDAIRSLRNPGPEACPCGMLFLFLAAGYFYFPYSLFLFHCKVECNILSRKEAFWAKISNSIIVAIGEPNPRAFSFERIIFKPTTLLQNIVPRSSG